MHVVRTMLCFRRFANVIIVRTMSVLVIIVRTMLTSRKFGNHNIVHTMLLCRNTFLL